MALFDLFRFLCQLQHLDVSFSFIHVTRVWWRTHTWAHERPLSPNRSNAATHCSWVTGQWSVVRGHPDVWCRPSLTSLLQVQFHDVLLLTQKLFPIVEAMQKYFSAGSGAYYSDAIFFLSVAMHHIMPDSEYCTSSSHVDMWTFLLRPQSTIVSGSLGLFKYFFRNVLEHWVTETILHSTIR